MVYTSHFTEIAIKEISLRVAAEITGLERMFNSLQPERKRQFLPCLPCICNILPFYPSFKAYCLYYLWQTGICEMVCNLYPLDISLQCED